MAKKGNDLVRVQEDANFIAYCSLLVSIVTLMVILIGGWVAYQTYVSSQADIVWTTGSYCPVYVALPQTFYNVTFINLGQSIGNINITVKNSIMPVFVSPLYNNGTLVLSGGQSITFRYELDYLNTTYPETFNVITRVNINNGARGATCLIQECSYISGYNASKYPYNDSYWRTEYERNSFYGWSIC